jgi:uncharacterized lipoprotein YmbA
VRASSMANRRLLLLSTLFALAGCFSLSRDAPAPRHWVLGPNVSAGAEAATEVTPSALIGMRTPRLSDYLASPFVVFRQGANEVGFSRFDLWGEGLAQAIGRSVAAHMGTVDPSLSVVFAPWSRETRPDHVVELQIAHFEGVVPEGPGASRGEAHLLAHWEIFRPLDGVRVARGTTEVRESDWPVDDVARLLALLEGGLATLAKDLVDALEAAGGPP